MDAPNPTSTAPTSRARRLLAWAESVLTAALLVFVAVRLAPQAGALVGWAPAGDEAPSFVLETLDGDTIRSAELRGRVVVVNFWATWCPPCRLEMPSLQKLYEERAPRGLVVLGFATDVGASPVREFVTRHGITFPVGTATPAHRSGFGGIPGVPTTFILDRDGRIRHRVVGYFTPPALRAAVGRLLGEAPVEERSGTNAAPPPSHDERAAP